MKISLRSIFNNKIAFLVCCPKEGGDKDKDDDGKGDHDWKESFLLIANYFNTNY